MEIIHAGFFEGEYLWVTEDHINEFENKSFESKEIYVQKRQIHQKMRHLRHATLVGYFPLKINKNF